MNIWKEKTYLAMYNIYFRLGKKNYNQYKKKK